VLRERLAADRDRRIAGVLLTQNETSTGVQNDVEALSRAIGEHPAIVVVDAVSGLGASRFAMDDWRFDVVVGASQKVLAAPPGLAMLALSARSWKRAEAPRAPRFSLDLARARDFARLGQTPWTPPVSIVFALDAALEAFACEGAPNVWRRHARYAEALRAGVQALSLALFSQDGAHSNTVVAVCVPAGVDAAAVNRTLREKHGLVIGGGQQDLKGHIFRIGTMGDLLDIDIVGAIGAFELALREHGAALAEPGAAVAAALRSLASRESPTRR
jgi:aspartate aminotransferase-like enzyme